uniref:Oberon coiled-coil region domain-containing protein n=1 Tax=Solanum lycopersicum TaxID=4081 RepID=A0A3Q7HBW3_SOLLC
MKTLQAVLARNRGNKLEELKMLENVHSKKQRAAMACRPFLLLSVKPSTKDDIDFLDSIVQIKEAETRMIQSLANDALGEVGSLKRLARRKR